MPRSPGAELLIALAGPAVNVAIAALLVGLGLLGGGLGGFGFNLLVFNVFLAAFNLVPAFPMDGGRVLRAALSGVVGRVRATAVAAGIGRGLAVAFGLVSLYYGLWFQVALAAFIYMAAGAELRGVVADEHRRRFGTGQGIWAAPPGYRWESRGSGRWQLAPIVVNTDDRDGFRWL
jgi:Zn-dependent protease